MSTSGKVYTVAAIATIVASFFTILAWFQSSNGGDAASSPRLPVATTTVPSTTTAGAPANALATPNSSLTTSASTTTLLLPATTVSVPPTIVAVNIDPFDFQKTGPNTYALNGSRTLDFRYGWHVLSESGQLSSGCYVRGVITSGNTPIAIDNNSCGGGWNQANLKAGTYRVTVYVTTDWGAKGEGHWDFQVSA
jgi:hypothetical protein